jgi:negative regulator of flagellin synthesis FlgM
MKIHGNKPPENTEINLSARKISKPEKDTAASAGTSKSLNDRVEISGAGKEAADLMSAINRLPDIRNDKVKAIKEAIESGKYHIDSIKIAGKMLEES